MNIVARQVNIFDLFAEVERNKHGVKSSLSMPDTTFKILSLQREKCFNELKYEGYSDYITMGINAKLSTIVSDRYTDLQGLEDDVFKKLNLHFLNKFYDDLFSDDIEKFNRAVVSVKALVNDNYVFIENIVRDKRCAFLKGSRSRVAPVGLRFDFKDHLGYTASVFTNNIYTSSKMNGEYLGNKKEGYNLYFLKYKEILPAFLYLKILRDYLDTEVEIKKEYNLMLEEAVNEIQSSQVYGVQVNAICNFKGIDILYSLKQFLKISYVPLSCMNLNSENLYNTVGRFRLAFRYYMTKFVSCGDLISSLLRAIFEDYHKNIKCTEYEIERERVMKSDYAASYQDKKTNNKKYLKAAEGSILTKYFTKIEIDTDVDLKLFNEYEKQIAYFYSLFGVKINGLELKLRKLGKHKAAGLFFPHANCLCVDIKNPSSFVHEFFHAIDYNKGREYVRCHSFEGFKHIHRLYTKILDEQVRKMDSSNPLKMRLFGNSKYNIDYYKDPYEVFARCGEIYFHELYGDKYSISNNLLNEGVFYPVDDEEIVQEITLFFDELFIKFKKEAV